MRKVQFSPDAIAQFQKFKSGNQKLAFKIFDLISDIQNTPFTGLGKPEALKGNFSGFWSRRINDEHRLVYSVTDDLIIIYSCYGHY
ncbi:Txe/YoeB family addiction module toxin [Niabella ginsengisoli]|uniref:Putative mRNA interferase YoeB n=1 Tax=Niabella ginsengisoli TaxID=522298 RepID=A0ABS9SID7_9BACT|nr:Txe/YoeB family addiction module toxin [Niabella ginsengisoli]MCH5598090.1 Txe/YoeB family addiction module toxin [Niabella ginsengisoli]